MAGPTGADRCVLWTTWTTERSFPRINGAVVPFAIETDHDGRYDVDARNAVVQVAVRQREADAPTPATGYPVRSEAGWISPGDWVVLEGEFDEQKQTVVARRLRFQDPALMAAVPHFLPPGALVSADPDSRETAAEPTQAPRPRGRRRPSGGGPPTA